MPAAGQRGIRNGNAHKISLKYDENALKADNGDVGHRVNLH